MAELDALQDLGPAFRDAGAELIAIAPVTGEHAKAVIAKQSLDFDILLDPGNVIADAFGLRHRLPDDLAEVYRAFGIDLAQANGDDSWTLPMPARYVVDAGGTVRSAHVHADYTRRPEPADTLEFVRAMAS